MYVCLIFAALSRIDRNARALSLSLSPTCSAWLCFANLYTFTQFALYLKRILATYQTSCLVMAWLGSN